MSDAVVERALGYPYPREAGAFVWRDGCVEPFTGIVPAESVPCIAHGSNASPQQLARKFPEPAGIEIPTIPVALLDHDVVYAPRINHYGSVPSTLTASPGTRSQVYLQWLSPRVLARMDETESIPSVYARSSGLSVILEDGSRQDAWSYTTVAGTLFVAGTPVALAEVSATGRCFPELSQAGIQRTVQDLLGAAGSIEEFIRENVANPDLRKKRCTCLARG